MDLSQIKAKTTNIFPETVIIIHNDNNTPIIIDSAMVKGEKASNVSLDVVPFKYLEQFCPIKHSVLRLFERM